MKNRKFYSLIDIKKHLVFTPLIFVFVIAIIAILLVTSIFEVKKNNEIKLFIQKENFNKKNMLVQYVNDIKINSSAFIDKEETTLNKVVDSLSGFIRFSKHGVSYKKIEKIIGDLERTYDFSFVIFDKQSLKILHGANILLYLKKIVDTKIEYSKFKSYMLKSILYIGNENLIYWVDKEKNEIRLSYFKNIENKNWYLGAFTKTEDIKNSIRRSILRSIVKKSKYYKNSYFWFYDYDLAYVYNYYGQGRKLKVDDILEKDQSKNSFKSNEILKRYKQNQSIKDSDLNYSFKKFNFLISVKSVKSPSRIEKLNQEYGSKLSIAITIIVLLSFILIVASIVFSKFINSIINRYNKRLERKTSMYKKWKDRYELAIIASNDGLWDINLNTKDIFFSKKWLEMFGYESSEIDNLEKWLNLIHKDDKFTVNKQLNEHISGLSEHFICEFRIKTKNEGFKWVLVRGKAFNSENNKPNRMLMMSMDINQRKKLTKELKYVDLLVEYGRIVIFKWKYDEDFTVEYLSKSISSYGYNRHDFVNKKIKYFDFVCEEDAKLLKKDLQKAIERNYKSFTKIFKVKNKDGSKKWVFNRTIFLKDDFGKVTHLYGYINDITEMKLNEEELKAEIASEVEKNIEKDRILVHQTKLAAMGEMLGSIAHQWRQPLNNINLLTHYIRDNYENMEKKELNEIIEDTKLQIDYMSQTIDDFRNFYQSNKDKEKFEIKQSIYSSVKIVQTQFEKLNISLQITGDEVEVINYKNEFQQVILNILNNANDAAEIKLNEEKDFKPDVKIDIKKASDMIIVTLENNCGEAPSDVIDRMFEPYFTTKFENKGTGIGLYMAKAIIEKNMKGKIEAKNKENGIIFTIHIPF